MFGIVYNQLYKFLQWNLIFPEIFFFAPGFFEKSLGNLHDLFAWKWHDIKNNTVFFKYSYFEGTFEKTTLNLDSD